MAPMPTVSKQMPHEEISGRYNDPPPNMEEISSGEFATSIFFDRVRDWCIEEHRSFVLPGRGPRDSFSSVWLIQWMNDGAGIAIASEWKATEQGGWVTTFWEFAACVHDLKFYSREHMHAPLYQCTKCGSWVGGEDTSD